MASKVSSGQSEIYRTRMLPVVSSSVHNSLPRDSRKDAKKTRSSSEMSSRKSQAHGFKPLFPLDTSNFVSKIVDRNSQDSKDTSERKPRLITPVSSAITKPTPYPKDLHKDVKGEDEVNKPPKLPPRKTLPANPPRSEATPSQQRRSLPSPRTEGNHSQTERTSGQQLERTNKTQNPQSGRKLSGSITDRTWQSCTAERKHSQSERTSSHSNRTSVGTEPKQNKERVDKTQNRSADQAPRSRAKRTEVSQNTAETDSKPLTRTNVTQHDKIWIKDEPRHESGALVPPLHDITPETTEELWNNFDPLDVLDSGSESSADTMIMMTTEEEQRNDEKIQQNQKNYENVKYISTRDNTPTRETSYDVGINNGNSVYVKHSKDLDLSPKSSEEDDGYGTNSSTSTNFSSLSSLGNGDSEQKPLHGILKKPGTSVSNSVNGSSSSYNTSQNGQSHCTWAVRRRTKLAEAQDNSLQEKLRQLAIIEEENTHDESQDARLGIVRRNSDVSNTGSFGYSSDNDSHWKNVVNSAPSLEESRTTRQGRPSEEEEKQEEVIQNDLKKFEGELYDKLTDMDLNYRNYYGFDNGQSNEIEDSKVLYFQQKMMKQQYGNDNYYNPSSHQSASHTEPIDYSRAHTMPTQSHNKANGMTSMPDLCRRAYATDSRHLQNYGVPNGYESHNTSYRSLASNNSGHFSSQDYMHGSNDNVSVHSGYSLPGNLYKTKYVSVDNVNQNGKKTTFASSADIYNLFQSKENLATQLQRPASYRHSFHAVPMTIAAGKMDPNDIFNEKEDPRPRSSSTSVGSKSKSWNPFGSLFSKKRSKSSQNSENSSKGSDSSVANGNVVKGNGQVNQIREPRTNPTPEMLPRRQLAEDKGPISPPVIKSSTLPRYTSTDKMFPDKPFKTIALFEESGTKLSTLV